MIRGSGGRIEMKRFVLLLIAPAFLGCALTPNVDTRKAGRPWNYYGDLGNVYRDQTGGTQVALVWLDQVQFRRVTQSEFQKTVRTLLGQGYRKIGMISVHSQYFVDPYEVRKLAADKGARLVVGCWFTAPGTRTKLRTVDYWYQLLDKAGAPGPSAIPQAPVVIPIGPAAPTGLPQPGVYAQPGAY
jgi:hypothetical protein